MKLGTTFDIDQAILNNLDPYKSLKKIIKMGISPIRIGIKWSRVEEKKGKYNWKDYDKIFKILAENNTPVILTVGMKSPRWPEYYIPEWTKNDNVAIQPSNFSDLKENLFKFTKKCINRYSKHSNITCIQIENEPFLPSGPDKWHIPEEFLADEIKYVRKLTKLPIMLTIQALPNTGILAEYIKGRNKYKKWLIDNSDIIGLHIYPKFEGSLFGQKKHIFKASESSWRYLNRLIKFAKEKGKKVWVTELQAEPWESGPIDKMDSYSPKTINPEIVVKNIARLKEMGIQTVLLWGIEFHLECLEEGNGEWMEKWKAEWKK